MLQGVFYSLLNNASPLPNPPPGGGELIKQVAAKLRNEDEC